MSEDRKRYKILVVDDDAAIAESLGLILRHHGYEVYIFTDAGNALEAARQVSPDLLITDVMTPKVTGISLAIQVRECCPSCKVILFSGYATAPVLLEIARANGHHFEALEKPLEPPKILERIRAVLDAPMA